MYKTKKHKVKTGCGTKNRVWKGSLNIRDFVTYAYSGLKTGCEKKQFFSIKR